MTISSFVLLLSLRGRLLEESDDLHQMADEVAEYSQGTMTKLKEVVQTKEDFEAFCEDPANGLDLGEIYRALDLDGDGNVTAAEVAALELAGAAGLGSDADEQLGDAEALTLANGAVREDGDSSTGYVDEAHGPGWVLDTLWADLLERADLDEDGRISAAEWESLPARNFAPASWVAEESSGDAPTGEPHVADAEDGSESLIVAADGSDGIAAPPSGSRRDRLEELESLTRDLPLSSGAEALAAAGAILREVVSTSNGSNRRRRIFPAILIPIGIGVAAVISGLVLNVLHHNHPAVHVGMVLHQPSHPVAKAAAKVAAMTGGAGGISIPTASVLPAYVRTNGACRGGNTPTYNAGLKLYMDRDCRTRCNGDSSCTGWTVSRDPDGTWCETYTSVGAVGDGRSQFWCYMKDTTRTPGKWALVLGNGIYEMKPGALSNGGVHGMQAAPENDNFMGCYDSAQIPDNRVYKYTVTLDVRGVWDCKTGCQAHGYPYYGFECPMSASYQVHCECHRRLPSKHLERTDCYNRPVGHCNGFTKVSGFWMGTAYRMTLYRSNTIGKWLDLRGRPTSQSSNLAHPSNPVASKAVDGYVNTFFSGNTCTHTNYASNNWWKVTLAQRTYVNIVRVTNRGDCCGDRLSGFEVYVDNAKCASNIKATQGATIDVLCGDTGTEVMIKQPKATFLTICEVQIFGLENWEQMPGLAPQCAAGGRRRLVNWDEDPECPNGPLSLCHNPVTNIFNWPSVVRNFLNQILQETARINIGEAITSGIPGWMRAGSWRNLWDIKNAVGTTIGFPPMQAIRDYMNNGIDEWYLTDYYTALNGFNWYGRARVIRFYWRSAWRHFLVIHPRNNPSKHVLLGQLLAYTTTAGAAAFRLVRRAGDGGWH